MRGFLFLALAISFEVFGTTMLKLSAGFTVLYPSIGVGIGFLTSFTFLGFSLKYLPLSNAYAIWSGLGTALTAGIGIILFREHMNVLKALALLLIIVGIVILNKAKDDHTKE